MTAGSILLADDEETFRETTRRLLERAGFECIGVKDAQQALDTLRCRRFDVLVSDIQMPHNADLQVVREAHALDSHLPVILVTGYPSTETAVRGIDMAVDAYLTKPLDIDKLFGHLRKAVERSRARRQLTAVTERLRSAVRDLEIEEANPLSRALPAPDGTLATIRTLASCLSELLVLWGKSAGEQGLRSLCELLDCPQQPTHRQAILETIEVLEKTKENFKSKQLAELRAKLKCNLGIRLASRGTAWHPTENNL